MHTGLGQLGKLQPLASFGDGASLSETTNDHV